MQFPTQKAVTLRLADVMVQGLSENPQDFPGPLFSADTLSALRRETREAMIHRQAARAAFKAALAAENTGLAKLHTLIRKFRQTSNAYQPDFPKNFLKLMSAVHSNPRLIPLAYLRRFGILL